jgi:hypothetical protein
LGRRLGPCHLQVPWSQQRGKLIDVFFFSPLFMEFSSLFSDVYDIM